MRQFIVLAAAAFALATGPAVMAKTAPKAKATTSAKTASAKPAAKAKVASAKPATKAKVATKTTTHATPAKWTKPAAKPAAKSKTVSNGHMVTTKTSTGKTITYDCSKAGNKTKAACKGKG